MPHMGIGSEFIREHLVFALDVLRRRWLLLALPILLAALLSAFAVKFAPTKYTAKSLILLQAANRSIGGSNTIQRSSTYEQVRAIEAWLKSDHVLAGILPQIKAFPPAKSPAELFIQTRALGASLTFELVGGSILEVGLEGRNPVGLGRDLEVILSRLMEGLTGPEQNIFSAPQFVLMRRSEDVAIAETALMKAINEGGFQAPLQVRAELQQLWTMTQRRGNASYDMSSSAEPPPETASDDDKRAFAAANRLRLAISENPKVVQNLERLYGVYQAALDRFQALQNQAGGARGNNYVGIFDSPDDLLIIGRPKDPIVGESVARKLAVAGILLSVIGGCGLVFLVELFAGLLRTRRDHENASGLQVVGRVSRIPRKKLAHG